MSVAAEPMGMEVELYRVLTNHIAAGVTVSDGRVVEAPEPMDWSVGKSLGEVQQWAERQGGKVERVEA